VEHVFCQTFTAGVPGIGQPLQLPLVPGGEDIYVTEDNRRAFVEAYVDCILSRAVTRQFEVRLHSDPET
jgi:HECT-domain (ubiquitin-transferase)